MSKRVKELFGFGGTGFLPAKELEKLNYHGKVRVLSWEKTPYLRPQSLYFDIVHIIGTHTFSIFKNRIINIK